jgi:glycosyltransferase involved in cell wall biosynthesis
MAMPEHRIAMQTDADICLIVEGGYPYVLGGVASWADAFMRASPQLRFHILAVGISSQPRQMAFVLPDNVTGVTDILLDVCPPGAAPPGRNSGQVERILSLLENALVTGDPLHFEALAGQLATTGYGRSALLDSRAGWLATEKAYEKLFPNGPLLDFFWSWRFLLCSLLAIASVPLPRVRLFHAVATGFAGVAGSFAKVVTGRPLLVTEHGIYTNERRIDLSVADWLFDSGAGGFGISSDISELRSVWTNAFRCFSGISYAMADTITTQYRANQTFQRLDGAPGSKLRIIPNGIDIARFTSLTNRARMRRPTVLMLARIVPIKDIRTFITAVSLLKEMVPDVVAIIIGPENEDPEYAEGCRQLVHQLDAASSINFLGRVPDIIEYLASVDVLALSSISEAQPIAMLEAAAVGLPVVSTDVGSCREIIEGFEADPVTGHGGIVVDPCNPKQMAEALAAILLDGEMRAEMGDVMRRRASTYYHKDRVKGLYEDLYAELAEFQPQQAEVQTA